MDNKKFESTHKVLPRSVIVPDPQCARRGHGLIMRQVFSMHLVIIFIIHRRDPTRMFARGSTPGRTPTNSMKPIRLIHIPCRNNYGLQLHKHVEGLVAYLRSVLRMSKTRVVIYLVDRRVERRRVQGSPRGLAHGAIAVGATETSRIWRPRRRRWASRCSALLSISTSGVPDSL